ANTLNDFSAYYDSDGTGQTYSGTLANSGISVSDSSSLVAVSTASSGLKYIIVQANRYSSVSNVVKYHFFLTPTLGQNASSRTKSPRYIQLMARGMGVLRVRTFLDGSKTATQTLYTTLSNRDSWTNTIVQLNGTNCTSMAIEI